jgi:hypothetical protein
VPRVPDNKARQRCLARQYSDDDGLRPADCKFPWQPILAALRTRTSEPPYLAIRLSHSTTRVRRRALPKQHIGALGIFPTPKSFAFQSGGGISALPAVAVTERCPKAQERDQQQTQVDHVDIAHDSTS